MARVRQLLLLAVLLPAIPANAYASLIGDTVDCGVPPSPFWQCSPTSAVVGAGNEFDILGAFFDPAAPLKAFEVDLDASSVTLSFAPTGMLGSVGFGDGTVLILSSLFGPLEEITGFGFSTTGDIPGLTASDVTISPHSLELVLDGSIDWERGDSATITFQTTTVPEPVSLTLLGLGLTGLGAQRWRQRKVS